MSKHNEGIYELRYLEGLVGKACLKIEDVYALEPLVNTTCNEYDTCTLICKISNSKVPVFWYKNGTLIDKTSNIKISSYVSYHILKIDHMKRKHEGIYELRCLKGAVGKAFLKFNAVQARKPLVNTTCNEYDTCTLKCEISIPNIPVFWYQNGKYIGKRSNVNISSQEHYHELTIEQMSIKDEGKYELRSSESVVGKAYLKFVALHAVKKLSDCIGYDQDECILECEISGSKAPVYWTKDGDFIVETHNIEKSSYKCFHGLTIRQMSKDDEGLYELRHKNEVITGAFLKWKAVFTVDLDSQECIEGDGVSFSCEVSGNNMAATWYKENKKIKATHNVVIEKYGTKHRITIKNAVLSDSADYSIRVKNVKQVARLIVKDFIKTHLVNTVIMEGLDVCLSCETEKSGTIAKWYKDEKEVQPSAESDVTLDESKGIFKLTIVNVNLGHKGTYRIDIKGHISEAFLDVKEMPQVLKEMSQHDRDTFMEAARAGTAPRYYIRIMIVGESGVGKTCLLRRLLKEEIDDVISTDGINIEVRKCKIELESGSWIFIGDRSNTVKWTAGEEKLADCGFWDFAGQKEYYATHQTFLSSNAIYILAVDVSKEWISTSVNMLEKKFDTIGEYIDFWLDNIHCYTTKTETNIKREHKHLNPPVMIVGTGTDNIQREPDMPDNTSDNAVKKTHIYKFESQLDYMLGEDIKRQHLQERLYVSNKYPDKSLSTFEELREKIFHVAQKMPKWGEHLPTRWILLEKKVLDVKENVVSYDIIRSFANECALPVEESNAELDAFLRYEHEIGNIIFFDEIRDYVIKNPSWLVDAFRCLVAPEQFQSKLINLTELKQFGKISEELITELFQKVPDFLKHKKYLIEVMEKFDILVRLPNLDHYYMPCMMNAASFEDICALLNLSQNECKRTSWFCIDFKFLPLGFFNHVLITFVRRYPLLMVKDKTPALYRGVGIFDLTTKYGCQNIALCASSYTIAMQIWNWSTPSQQKCIQLREELLDIVKDIQQRYRIRIEYTVNLQCFEGHYYLPIGKINPLKAMNMLEYFCDEHHKPHKSVEVYGPWFMQDKKDQDQNTDINLIENHEKRDRCTFCSREPPMNWCHSCKITMCDDCNSQHQVYHDTQDVEDKFTPDYSFCVSVHEICDFKVVTEELFCIIGKEGKKLITVDRRGRIQQDITLPSYPWCIAVVDSSIVAVTIYYKVVVVDIKQGRIIKRFEVKGGCKGIIFNKSKLFVGCNDRTIKVMSMSGEITRTIQLNFTPWYICGSNDGSIYCSDGGKLYCIDTEGKLRLSFAHPYIKGHFSIAIDDTGDVLCYYDNKILSISSDGKRCQIVVKHTKGFGFKYICYIQKSKSLVLGGDANIDVYKLCNDS